MSKVSEAVKALAEPIAAELGLELVEVEYKKQHDSMHLTVFIDKDGGVNLEDCEKMHKAIDEPLDRLDPTDGAKYVLNVSSPGLDRPLKTERDYKKNLGKEVEVSLFAAIDGIKKFEAVLFAYDEKTVTLKTNKENLIIERTDVAVMKPVIKF